MELDPKTGEPVVATVVEPTMEEVAGGTKEEVKPVPDAVPVQTEAEKAAALEVSPASVETPADTAQDAIQKRINKITADKYAEKRRADELQAKLDAQTVAAKPVLPVDAPQLEDFDFDDGKHQEALIQYKIDKALETQSQIQNQQRTEQAKQKLSNEFTNKEAEYIATHPEYVDEIGSLPMFDQDTLDVIYQLGPQVSHYLAKNLDVAAEVNSVSLSMAAVKLGQISTGLSVEKKVVKPSTAPDPVSTLAGGGAITKSQDDMSMDEIMSLP